MIIRELFKEAMCTMCVRLNNVDEYCYVYKESMCIVCERLNAVDVYRYVYDLKETHQRCITPYDI